MKIKAIIATFILGSIFADAEPQFVAVTASSGQQAFQATDIIQIVGAVTSTAASVSSGASTPSSPSLEVTFSDGTVVSNRIASIDIEATYYGNSANNPLLGATLTNVTYLRIVGGSAAVTVKVMKQAAEFTSEPVMLPLIDDGTYTIQLETSVDMINWAPAAPGDYLGSTSHRFFRVKATKKATTP